MGKTAKNEKTTMTTKAPTALEQKSVNKETPVETGSANANGGVKRRISDGLRAMARKAREDFEAGRVEEFPE